MSEENQEPPAVEEVPVSKPARKRPAVRKSAKAAKPEGDDASANIVAESPPVASETSFAPVEAFVEETDGRAGERSSEVIPFVVETAGGELPPGNPKKRRRRKKKHGQGQGAAPLPSQQHPHAVAPPAEQPFSPVAEASPAPVMHAAPRPKLDPDQVAKKAWKIFQAEVGEEGLALIDDHDAREISRRCFRLAEIFLDEAARRNR